jgi:hypothetical protein
METSTEPDSIEAGIGIHLVVRASFTEPKRFSNTSIVKVLHCTSSVAVRVNGDTAPSLLPFMGDRSFNSIARRGGGCIRLCVVQVVITASRPGRYHG